MSILFQPACFSSSKSYHFQHSQDQLLIFSTVFVSFVPSCLCFPRHPTLFLQGLRFLNQVSCLLMRSLFILFFQCSYPVISHEDAQQFQVHHPPFSFLLRWIQFQAFSVDHILFLVSNAFSYRCTS